MSSWNDFLYAFADNVGSLEVIFDKILLKINRFCWSIDFFCIFANSIRAR